MFLNRIYAHARATPDKIAVVSSGRVVSYRRFAQFVDAVRNHLVQTPLPADGVVVEMGGNLLHAWVLQLALRSLGRTTVSAPSWKVIETLDLGEIAAMVCHADNRLAIAAVAAARPGCAVITIPSSIFADIPPDHLPAPIEQGSFGDHILYTSGSTGTYKKLRFRGDLIDQLVTDGIEGAVVRSISSDAVYHDGNLGPWTIVGYRVPIAYWYHGATVIFEQRPDWPDYFFDHPVTTAVLMPPMLRQLCESGARPDKSTPLRVVTGGGFIGADLALQATRQLGCALFVNYGGSETRVALESEVRSEEDVVWLTPLFDRAVEIVDEDDVPVLPGEEGIVRIRSAPTDPGEYLDDAEASARHFREGCFYPGDMAVRRADGRVRILGRVADVLTVDGRKLVIGPFEERARAHLKVANLCMFVQQTDAGEEELLVVIEGDQMPDEARCEAMAAATPEHFARTRFARLDRFPRGDNGMMKINRRQVLRLANETVSH